MSAEAGYFRRLLAVLHPMARMETGSHRTWRKDSHRCEEDADPTYSLLNVAPPNRCEALDKTTVESIQRQMRDFTTPSMERKVSRVQQLFPDGEEGFEGVLPQNPDVIVAVIL
jgi:hypothetical protein